MHCGLLIAGCAETRLKCSRRSAVAGKVALLTSPPWSFGLERIWRFWCSLRLSFWKPLMSLRALSAPPVRILIKRAVRCRLDFKVGHQVILTLEGSIFVCVSEYCRAFIIRKRIFVVNKRGLVSMLLNRQIRACVQACVHSCLCVDASVRVCVSLLNWTSFNYFFLQDAGAPRVTDALC